MFNYPLLGRINYHYVYNSMSNVLDTLHSIYATL